MVPNEWLWDVIYLRFRFSRIRGVVPLSQYSWLSSDLPVRLLWRKDRSRFFSIRRFVLLYGLWSAVRAGVYMFLWYRFYLVDVSFRGVQLHVGGHRARPTTGVRSCNVECCYVVHYRCATSKRAVSNVYIERRHSYRHCQRSRNRFRLLLNEAFCGLIAMDLIRRQRFSRVVGLGLPFCGNKERIFHRFPPCFVLFVYFKVVGRVYWAGRGFFFAFVLAVFICGDGDRAPHRVVYVSRFTWVFWACSRSFFRDALVSSPRWACGIPGW